MPKQSEIVWVFVCAPVPQRVENMGVYLNPMLLILFIFYFLFLSLAIYFWVNCFGWRMPVHSLAYIPIYLFCSTFCDVCLFMFCIACMMNRKYISNKKPRPKSRGSKLDVVWMQSVFAFECETRSCFWPNLDQLTLRRPKLRHGVCCWQNDNGKAGKRHHSFKSAPMSLTWETAPFTNFWAMARHSS
jgi:hypothetical protein